MSGVTIGLILEKISSRDKDFRYMATSDLSFELAKPSFYFDSPNTENSVAAAIIKQLEDQSSDISSLATKCLGLLVNKVGEARLGFMTQELIDKMINSKKEQEREVAALGLKTVIVELELQRAGVMAAAAAPRLIEGLRNPAQDVASNSLDALVETTARHGAALPDHNALCAALLPELDASRSGIRKRAIHCLALLGAFLQASALDSLAGELFARLEGSGAKKDQVRTYVQALGALSRSVGFKLGPHFARGVPLVLSRLKAAGEGDDELMELCLLALESFVHRAPGDARPFLDDLVGSTLHYMRFDPNYAADDDEAMGGEEEEFDEEEEPYSDDEDGSWKVRRAAAKLAAALIGQYADAVQALYPQLAPALVSRFKEREEAVRPDVHQAYVDLVRAAGAAARRGDAAGEAALVADVPGVMRALARQLRGRSSKTKSLALRTLQELVRAAPAAVVASMGDATPGIKAALEDKSTGASTLKIDALAFVNTALTAAPPASFQSHALSLTPAVITAAEDRYYAVSADALRACEQLVHVLRPECPAAVPQELSGLVMPLFTAVVGRLAAQDLSLEVKEAAISCAATVVAVLGDILEGDSSKVGSLAEEFAAMPKSKSRAAKRVKTAAGPVPVPESQAEQGQGKVAEVLSILLERMRNEITRLSAVRALTTIARSPVPLDLSPALPQALADLTSFLRKASRQLRLAALAALTALVSRDGPRADPMALEAAVAEAAPLVEDADLAVAAASLRLMETIVREQIRAVDAVCEKVLGPAVALVGSPLLQGSVLAALQALLAALAASGAPAASSEQLLRMLSDAGTAAAAGAGAPLAAARCAAALCRTTGEASVAATASTMLAGLEAPGASEPARRFALLCLGELGRGSDLTGLPSLPAALTAALGAEEVAEAASWALGGVASGNLRSYLPLVLQHVRAQAGDAKMQYQLLRALNEAITTCAHQTDGKMPPEQVSEVLALLLSGEEREEECRAVVSECLGHLALLAPADVLGALHSQLGAPAANARLTAVSALRHAAVEREHPIDVSLAELLPPALGLIGDADVGVRRGGVHLLTAAAHNKPALVSAALPAVLPQLLEQTKPNPALIRTVDLGPFKHKIDDGLELRKAAFECVGVLMAKCYDRLDSGALVCTLMDGLKDAYDVKMQCHALLGTLAAAAPGPVTSSLDRLVEPLAATLTARIKSDAVKQEVDRNEDMLRSCLRAVDALAQLPGALNVAAFKQFMDTTVASPAMKERYAAIQAERRQAVAGGGGFGAGGGAEAMDIA